MSVLVVDRDRRSRAELVRALRGRGVRAFGAHAAVDAVAVFEHVATDVVVLRSGGDPAAIGWLERRAIVVAIAPGAPIEEALGRVLAAFTGESPSAN